MAKKKFAWRKEDILATFNTPSKNKPDDKAEIAPESGKPADWFNLRNMADSEKESLLRPAPMPKT